MPSTSKNAILWITKRKKKIYVIVSKISNVTVVIKRSCLNGAVLPTYLSSGISGTLFQVFAKYNSFICFISRICLNCVPSVMLKTQNKKNGCIRLFCVNLPTYFKEKQILKRDSAQFRNSTHLKFNKQKYVSHHRAINNR